MEAGAWPSAKAQLVFRGAILLVGAGALAVSGGSLSGALVLLLYAFYAAAPVLLPQGAILTPGFFICGDVFFVTLIMHFTGGLFSLAFLGYPIIVVFTGLWLGTAELAVGAGLSLIYFVTYGAVASARSAFPGEPAKGLADVLARCGLIALAAGSALSMRVFVESMAERRAARAAGPAGGAAPQEEQAVAVAAEMDRMSSDAPVSLSGVDALLRAGAVEPSGAPPAKRTPADVEGELSGWNEMLGLSPQPADAAPAEEGGMISISLEPGAPPAPEAVGGTAEAVSLEREVAGAESLLGELERELGENRRRLAELEERYKELRAALGAGEPSQEPGSKDGG